MKNLNIKLMILLAGISLIGAACSRNDSTQNGLAVVNNYPGSAVGPITDTGSSTSPTTVSANSVAFVPTSLQEFNSYVATHPLNNPTDLKITIDLQKVSSDVAYYGGTVKLSYTDNGATFTGTFIAGSGQNTSMKGLRDNGTYEAAYNYWFLSGGKQVFSGFFQDAFGAIVVVIDNTSSQGDAQGAGSLTGAVYYKNFAQSYAEQSPYRKCWFISAGPFSCRDTGVINKSSVYPTDGGYKLLGTFSGLNKAQSFK